MSQTPYSSAEQGRTIVRPMPGGRPVQTPTVATPATDQALFDTYTPLKGGLNPVLTAANPLLALAPQIRQSTSHPDPHRLKDDLTRGIREFEKSAAESGVRPQHIIAARYILCTFLDECAASTPWGGGGLWAKDTLLVRLHNETWGGEKVFQLLSRLAQEPAANRDLLELIYVCLGLGFEGRYRVVDNGRSYLETIRARLYELISQQAGPVDRTLSLKWQPAQVKGHRWLDLTPLWVIVVLSLTVATAAYLSYRSWLNSLSDPVFSMIQSISPPHRAVAEAPPAPAPEPVPRLAGFLEPEVAAGLVAVRETANKSVITLRGDGVFQPGSTQVSSTLVPLLDRIANELKQRPGTVVVSGHTDSQPIRSVRFPSNYHLSEERARVVAKMLATTLGADRVKSEGKADAEPIADNSTAAGRARNRRVEITLLTAG